MEFTKERLIEVARLLATPIDFERLIADGVLSKSARGWYLIHKPSRLPEHAWQQVSGIRSESTANVTESKTYFKFGQGGPAAAKLYEQLTGVPFSA